MLPYETRFVDRDSDAAATRSDELNQQAEMEKQALSEQNSNLKTDADANLQSNSNSNSNPNPTSAFSSFSSSSSSSPFSRPLSLSSTSHELPTSLQPELSSDDLNPDGSNSSDMTKTSTRFHSAETNEEVERTRPVRFHLDESAFHNSSLDSPSRSLKQQQQMGLYEDPVDETHKYAQNRFISPKLATSSHSQPHSKFSFDPNSQSGFRSDSGSSSGSNSGTASHSRQISMTDTDWDQLQEGKKANSNTSVSSGVTGM